jgi:hypothetical protein
MAAAVMDAAIGGKISPIFPPEAEVASPAVPAATAAAVASPAVTIGFAT